ncbi:MAG: gliding motility-associated C-terminal domain-containing protein [Bacteroidetes bacterium]|nr:gliding motility-associated C-terminal domain-containing protein [Bacteroidota bacterium]
MPEAIFEVNLTGFPYSQALVVRDQCGQTDTVQLTVSNEVDTPLSQTYSYMAEQCFAGHSLGFATAGTIEAGTYTWDFGPEATPGTSNQVAPTGITYSQAGMHEITLAVQLASGCITRDTFLLTLELPLESVVLQGFGSDTLVENCGTNQRIRIRRTGGTTTAETLSWTLAGTATQGLDYTLGLTSPQTFAVGQEEIELPVNVLTDVLDETDETLELIFNYTPATGLCAGRATEVRDTFVIRDFRPLVAVHDAEQQFCLAADKTIGPTVSGGFGNYRYLWSTGQTTPTIVPSASGTYSLLVVDSCSSGTRLTETLDFDVEIYSEPAMQDSTYAHCLLGAYTLQAPQVLGGLPPFEYQWTAGGTFVPASTFEVNLAGFPYSQALVVRDQCGETDTVQLTVVDTPVGVQRYRVDSLQCFEGHAVDLQVAGAAVPIAGAYSWSFGPGASPATHAGALPPVVTYAAAGVYTISLNIALPGGCNYDTSLVVRLTTPEEVALAQVATCQANLYQFVVENPTAGADYRWSRVDPATGTETPLPSTGSSLDLEEATQDSITLLLTNVQNPCTRVQRRYALARPVASFLPVSGEAKLNELGFAELPFLGFFRGDGNLYSWQIDELPGAGSYTGPEVSMLFEATGTYSFTLTVTDADGCDWSARCEQCITILPGTVRLQLSNVFTPNADGRNDRWPDNVNTLWPVRVASLKIFDRLGVLAYEGQNAWDGTTDGANAFEGTYFYVLELEDNQSFTGSVTLLR